MSNIHRPSGEESIVSSFIAKLEETIQNQSTLWYNLQICYR